MERLVSYFAPKRHIIWDWNGTLLDDLHWCHQTLNKVLADFGIPAVTTDDYLKKFQFPVKSYYEKIGFDFSVHSFEAVNKRFGEHYHSGFASCKLRQGIKNVLANNKSHGKTQSILSATQQHFLYDVVSHFRVDDLFDHVFGLADNHARCKKARGKELLEKSGIPAAETILVGDTDHDIEVGRELGIDVVILSGGHQCPDRVRTAYPQVPVL
jgi:phosphoglycolate phosphatase